MPSIRSPSRMAGYMDTSGTVQCNPAFHQLNTRPPFKPEPRPGERIRSGTIKESENAQLSLFDRDNGRGTTVVSDWKRNNNVQWYHNQTLPSNVCDLRTEVQFTPTGTRRKNPVKIGTATPAAQTEKPESHKREAGFLL